MEAEQPPLGAHGPVAALGRLPTGAKLFLILSAALLPLAVIAFIATLQTTHTADRDTHDRLNVDVRESARALAFDLNDDMAVLRREIEEHATNATGTIACPRAEGLFAQQGTKGARFAIRGRDGKLLCGSELPIETGAPADANRVAAHIVPGRGLSLYVIERSGVTATAYFPTEVLRAVARPSGFMPSYGATVRQGSDRLALERLASSGPLDRREHASFDVGVDRLALDMEVNSAPITSSLIIALLLPLLMWAAAAAIAWFVVDGFLIRPLRRLRSAALAFKPGEIIDPQRFGQLPAQEIRELGNTFRDISRMVLVHESDMAAGLARQTKLTREVHHRVKNNLQVIGSLINFHARGAKSGEAAEAYAAIQRRVDALAVVHRHHYAELEENRGLELRSVIGELASNIRATAPEASAGLGITLAIEPLLVTQDFAVAVAFLITEIVEMAINVNPTAQIRISVKPDAEPGAPFDRAVLRVSSPALIDSPQLESLIQTRYGRVIGGLVRQLRTRLHHDPLVGAYETVIAVTGRA